MKWLRRTQTSSEQSSKGLLSAFRSYKHIESCKRQLNNSPGTVGRDSWQRSQDIANSMAPGGGAFTAQRRLKKLTNSYDLQSRRLARQLQNQSLPRLKRAAQVGLVPLLVLLAVFGFW